MQETIQALDTMHFFPRGEKKYDLFFNRMFSYFQKKHNDIKEHFMSLESLKTIFIINQRLIDEGNGHCNYISYNLDKMWLEWNKKYKTLTKGSNKFHFFDYLSKKLYNKINQIMVDKFINLGFKFDSSAQKIAVPIPKQLNSDVDNSSNYIITDEMTALMQTESNEDTILMSTNEESVPSENIRTPKIDIFQQGLNPDVSPEEILEPMDIDKKKNNLSTNEESVPPENIRTPKIDIFQQESRDKELEDPSENLNTPELIDFLKQGLNPDMSPEEILEPMDIDKKKITEYIFL
ncbi:uncharacterized protein LOC126908462 isoform X28 [Daktulosphaira vitifoliae]|uniref:uncharacterized protein LOC126908462 isoform X28 n=1 Tax=Daktulosphaira vitifoliae TaxID=58002 RepID=UPI0021A9A5F4|nr:uncharacterized protein LOC126908462 isoform X28 [Daktulosphaira vitifoliae]